jgi:hypothetical protein
MIKLMRPMNASLIYCASPGLRFSSTELADAGADVAGMVLGRFGCDWLGRFVGTKLLLTEAGAGGARRTEAQSTRALD